MNAQRFFGIFKTNLHERADRGLLFKITEKERKYKFNKNSLFYTQVRFLVVHNGEAKYREKIQNKTMKNYSTNESKFDNG